MSSAGQQLRAAREAQGLTVHQVADVTKMKTDHIRALEEGTYGAFAAPIYIRGFARTYARMLRLDAERLVATIDEELALSGRFDEGGNDFPGNRGVVDYLMLQLSRVNWKLVLPLIGSAVLILVVVQAYRFWAESRHADPLKDLGPARHQPSEVQPVETLPMPTNAPPPR